MEISDIIFQAECLIHYSHVQNYDECSRLITSILEKSFAIDRFSKSYFDKNDDLAQIVDLIKLALETGDMILLSDTLTDAFIPKLKEMVEYIEPVEYNYYRLEATSAGYPTLYSKVSGLYLHSNSDPMEEARELANFIFSTKYDEYAVWGCGLGYHFYQLFEISNGSCNISVFDDNDEVFDIAKQKGMISQIPDERLELVKDTDGKLFSRKISNSNVGVFMHYPSVLSIQNISIRNIMESFFPKWNTTIQLKRELEINYRINQSKVLKCVDELVGELTKKDVVLVAGGPSVDYCVDWLRYNQDKKIVVVTRVLKKLLDLGIEPDYAVTLDSNKLSYKQIDGIKDTKVPIILDSTAYWEYAMNYPGEKYIAFQEGYHDAELYAKDKNYKLYHTGGSVTTLALDILLQMNVKRIYLVGADMAYPSGVTHASDTVNSVKINTEGMLLVPSVSGSEVPTSIQLNNCRKWMEKRIAEHPDIEVYNLSPNGAHIVGTKVLHI
ncbi:MAG: motility associated factor glycosyltransferase family protein [Lachnospiraceae bacterium]|nr:motility associated factor glycosyltransferase family protein [Lachnospiraceae bacterium]